MNSPVFLLKPSKLVPLAKRKFILRHNEQHIPILSDDSFVYYDVEYPVNHDHLYADTVEEYLHAADLYPITTYKSVLDVLDAFQNLVNPRESIYSVEENVRRLYQGSVELYDQFFTKKKEEPDEQYVSKEMLLKSVGFGIANELNRYLDKLKRRKREKLKKIVVPKMLGRKERIAVVEEKMVSTKSDRSYYSLNELREISTKLCELAKVDYNSYVSQTAKKVGNQSLERIIQKTVSEILEKIPKTNQQLWEHAQLLIHLLVIKKTMHKKEWREFIWKVALIRICCRYSHLIKKMNLYLENVQPAWEYINGKYFLEILEECFQNEKDLETAQELYSRLLSKDFIPRPLKSREIVALPILEFDCTRNELIQFKIYLHLFTDAEYCEPLTEKLKEHWNCFVVKYHPYKFEKIFKEFSKKFLRKQCKRVFINYMREFKNSVTSKDKILLDTSPPLLLSRFSSFLRKNYPSACAHLDAYDYCITRRIISKRYPQNITLSKLLLHRVKQQLYLYKIWHGKFTFRFTTIEKTDYKSKMFDYMVHEFEELEYFAKNRFGTLPDENDIQEWLRLLARYVSIYHNEEYKTMI